MDPNGKVVEVVMVKKKAQTLVNLSIQNVPKSSEKQPLDEKLKFRSLSNID